MLCLAQPGVLEVYSEIFMRQIYMIYTSDPKETCDFILCICAQVVAPGQLRLLLKAFPSLAPEQLQCRTSLQREIIQDILQQPGQ